MAFNMFEEANKRKAVFKDTLAYFEEEPALAAAIKNSIANTQFYPEGIECDFSGFAKKKGNVIVSNSNSYGFAVQSRKENKDARMAVLNFASSTTPGGGVKRGSRAQEETLCRTSTLYPVITTKELDKAYYGPNKRSRDPKKALNTDALIYTPDIVICKTTGTYPERIQKEEFTYTDVINCAAPNLRVKPTNTCNADAGEQVIIGVGALYDLHVSRAKHIMYAAAKNNVDILILGAFGCGAFANDPAVVAKAYKDVLAELGCFFDAVVFPIPGGENLKVFGSVLLE